MTLPFYVIDHLEGVGVGDEVSLTGEEAHHAVAVRRHRPGERLSVTTGRGLVATGVVTQTGKRQLTLEVDELATHPCPEPRLTVLQALAKGDRGELAVELLTEIGVQRIVPWSAARSVAVWRGERAVKSRAKWQATAREAAKQARRPWHPEIAPLHTEEQLRELVAGAALAVALHEEASAALAAVEPPERGDVVVIVGPEGGLTDDERTAFAATGAVGVRLGGEVLRTSTAGVAACAALLARTARWSTTSP